MTELKQFSTKPDAGKAAADVGAAAIRTAIETRGRATVVVATGASQFEMLESLVQMDGVDWSKVTAFHLDEYIGISDHHPASFRRYLRERFTSKLPTLGAFHFINGDVALLDDELARLNRTLDAHPIDITFAGIGENGHLAFNDPPADFEAAEAYKIVSLDERCRRQQFGEGWFSSYEDVPERAISMTVQRILSSETLVLTVLDERKSEAVKEALEGPISNICPASIIQQHPNCHLFLDIHAAQRLSKKPAVCA
ncbi:glucosamine-6-phosphate deaminase [Rhizobium sp. BK376]|uniref:glucosamine-6-phosphate deaminase n=1 Tax=Rhizobium sp. BK376 TaxID=2512149 RepID=UPI001045F056|nr:glucosamine-6-phosphate deaminase [Rhizobium sp. BK376]TCR79505.1 glucosamine-6-phosphate deaminase [Rhizobium sp. BK376]